MPDTAYESKGKTGEYKQYFLQLHLSERNQQGGLEEKTGGPMTEEEKRVLNKLVRTYECSVSSYEEDLKKKLDASNGSVDVALELSEELRILGELKKRAEEKKSA